MTMQPPAIIPHSRPFLGAEEAHAVTEVITTGGLAEGPVTAAYERELGERMGCAHAVAVSSGTAALHLALAALGIGAGDEVIIPSFVCTALFHAVAAVGATPVPADIDPATLNLDPGDVERRITARTRALILAHMFGRMADPGPFTRFGLALIEDCAHALGATCADRQAGSFGHAAVVSSYATKMIATGEGGAVATSSAPLASAVRDLKQYDHRPLDRVRCNCKFTELQAAMGCVQLRRLDEFIRRRREIAARFRSSLGPPAGDTDREGEHVYFRYVIDAGSNADDFIRAARLNGIACERPVHEPLHRLLNRTGFPATEEMWRRCVSIPIYPALTAAEVEHIVSVAASLR